jgi:CubicO group peptidase (beta-lactamase class C family)
MEDTSFVVPEGGRARSRSTAGQDGLKGPVIHPVPETYSSGAGGLSSTAADYFRFAQMLADGGQLDGNGLSPRGWNCTRRTTSASCSGQAGRPKGMGFS